MPADIVKIGRALISVSDKAGLIDLAKALAGRGVELLSTGGTAAALGDAGLPVVDVAQLTGFPEMMDGRVKTLHPRVHGGLLAIRADPSHQAAMIANDIAPIDLLIVNLYPFEATLRRGASFEDKIENIDIGGPAMVRGAAKNHEDVVVIVDAADYADLLAELDRNDGGTSLAFRRRMAQKAFARTAAYDAAISNWLAEETASTTPKWRAFGGVLHERFGALRYGENPHQDAALYLTAETRDLASRPRDRSRARSSPTTTSTTPTPPMNWWPSSIRPRAPRSRSSSTPIPAGSRSGRASPRPMRRRWPAIRFRPSAASSR